MPDLALATLESPYTFVISKFGSQYIAYNTVNKTETSSSSAHVIFNLVIDSMNAAGGGYAFIKAGVYYCTDSINPKDKTGFEGEKGVIIRHGNNTADHQLFRYWAGASSALLDSFMLKHLRIEIHNLNQNGTGETESGWISSGTKNFFMEDVAVISFASAASFMKIGFFLDTAGGTNNNEGAKVINCYFEGDCGGQDFLGCGMMIDCDISHNRFKDCTSQAIGVGSSYNSIYDNNNFRNTGKAIGFETECIGNQIHNNTCYITDGIKLSQEGSTTDLSMWNSVKGNKLIYGEGGIEAGYSIDDDIDNNTIIRTERNGIRGAFLRAKITNNKLIDTNWSNASQTVNSVSKTVGGILCLNNTGVIASSADNEIKYNTLVDTGVAFTEPTTGLSKNGNTGPIILDAAYDNTSVFFNKYKGLVEDFVDNGTNLLRIDANDKIISIESNLEDLVKIYRNINTANSFWGITFDAKDSAGARATYGKIQANIVDNTAASKDSYISFKYLVNNTLTERFYAYNNRIGFGGSGSTCVEFDSVGISGGTKLITWGNFAGEPAIINAAQTLTNKWVQGFRGNYNPKTGNYTATTTDDFIPVNATSGNVTITLPAVSGNGGKIYRIQKTDSSANTVTIDGNSTELINDAQTLVLTAQYQMVTLVCDGTKWETPLFVVEKGGEASATANGSTTVFTIAHGLGTTPNHVFVECSTHTGTFTRTKDATNITITYGTAPPASPGTIKFDWRATK